jgi:hypothetical protein
MNSIKFFFPFQNSTTLLYPWVPVQAIKLILFVIILLGQPNPFAAESDNGNPLHKPLLAVFDIG